MSAVMRAYAAYDSAPAHKLLSDNRDLYIAQSAATVAGCPAPFPGSLARAFDPDTADVTDDAEPDLPWEPLPGDHDYDETPY